MISPIRRRARTIEVLISALKATASRQRTIFVVEDLHWADPSTLELLQLIMASAPRLPLLGIFTARPEVQSVWTGAGVASLIEVSRLSNDEVVAVVSSIARGKLIPGEVMRSLTQRCEGVPLFVEEVTRALVESGALRNASSRGNSLARADNSYSGKRRRFAHGQDGPVGRGARYRPTRRHDRPRILLCRCCVP